MTAEDMSAEALHRLTEVNFDGLVGPTHNFAGLSFGNVASSVHSNQVSYPKDAALQGLEKMQALFEMGLPQGLLLPHPRPHIPFLRRLGFAGTDAQVIETAAQENPQLLINCSSASNMWAANAATISPSPDTFDGNTHITPANLSSMLHRSIEHDFTGAMLKRIFQDEQAFTHHQALPSTAFFGDEGAANHTRLCSDYTHQGLEIFVYGQAIDQADVRPQKFPARQTLAASQAIARLHNLKPESCLFIQQNPEVIDQGVFHNDVISVGHKNLLLTHELAFVDQAITIDLIKTTFTQICGDQLCIIEVPESIIDTATAIKTYLFNSQLVDRSQGGYCLIAPQECQNEPQVAQYLNQLVNAEDNPLNEVRYFDLKQSMSNGGGPACLRLRVWLSEVQITQLGGKVMLNKSKLSTLNQWIHHYYPDELRLDDLYNPATYKNTLEALKVLEQLLGLPGLYDS